MLTQASLNEKRCEESRGFFRTFLAEFLEAFSNTVELVTGQVQPTRFTSGGALSETGRKIKE
jgi:hypothetical protein